MMADIDYILDLWIGIGPRKNRQRDCGLPGRLKLSMCFYSHVTKRTIKMCGITAPLLSLKRRTQTYLFICQIYSCGYRT